MRNFLLSTLAGSIFYMIFGFIVFDLIFGPYSESNTTHLEGFKKTLDFSWLFLYFSCLAYSLLINFLLYQNKISSFFKAFLFSAIVGVLIACMTDFYWFASSNFYLNFLVLLLDILGSAICVGSLGMVSFFIQMKKQR